MPDIGRRDADNDGDGGGDDMDRQRRIIKDAIIVEILFYFQCVPARRRMD